MNRLLCATLVALLALPAALLPTAAPAEPRQYLGAGRMLTNDLLGDGHDRWRSGSYVVSRVWGPEWTGRLPERMGRLLEFRIHGEIITPQNLSRPAPGDRPFAGALSFGLHSHFRTGPTELALGADLVVTGPQTRLDDFQDLLHDVLGGREQSGASRNAQIGDDVTPTLVIEAGRGFDLGGAVRLRPFVEGRLGAESLLRAGADLDIGPAWRDALMLRAPVSGHRYPVAADPARGLSWVLGADLAYVGDSVFLPESRGFDLTDTRSRLRAGLRWETAKGTSAFYGLTWLSEEFEAQKEGQLVGSLRLKLNF